MTIIPGNEIKCARCGLLFVPDGSPIIDKTAEFAHEQGEELVSVCYACYEELKKFEETREIH